MSVDEVFTRILHLFPMIFLIILTSHSLRSIPTLDPGEVELKLLHTQV